MELHPRRLPCPVPVPEALCRSDFDDAIGAIYERRARIEADAAMARILEEAGVAPVAPVAQAQEE